LQSENKNLKETFNAQFTEVKKLREINEDQEATIKYDKGRIKTLMHDNDMAKRNNKELEDKLSLTQEKMNELFSKMFAQENEMESLKLSIDRHKSIEEGLIKDRDYFKVHHDTMEEKYSGMDQRLAKLQSDYHLLTWENTSKEKQIIDFTSQLEVYEQQFKDQQAKIENLKKDIDDLDKENQTLAENNKTYIELNDEQKKEIEKITENMKKINDERNHVDELLESANDKIGAFIQQINAKEELLAVLNRERDKLSYKLTKSEKECHMLEVKKESMENILEIERIEFKDQIKTYTTQVNLEK